MQRPGAGHKVPQVEVATALRDLPFRAPEPGVEGPIARDDRELHTLGPGQVLKQSLDVIAGFEGWCDAHHILLRVTACPSRRALMVITSSLSRSGSGGKQAMPFQQACAEEVL